MDDRVLEWCTRLIGCRSVTTEGTREIADLCARELLRPAGIEPRLLPSTREGAAQVNLIATIKGRDSGVAPLLLNTHLDTVPPGNPELWNECGGDPFRATLKGERIYGLGAADTKLDFVAKVMGLADARPRRDVWLVATFGEEHGLIGARELAESGVLPRGARAFIGEPARLEVILAHKGLMVFELRVRFEPRPAPADISCRRIVFKGQAAHSSTPALGRNAIVMALEAIAARPETRVFSITGGDAVNKVPAWCEAVIALDGTLELAGSDARIEAAALPPGGSIAPAAIALMRRFVHELREFANNASGEEIGYAPPALTCNPGLIRCQGTDLVLDFELRPPPGLALDVVREGVAIIVARLAREDHSLAIELNEQRANPGFRSPLNSETVEIAMAALARAGLPLNTGVKAGCTEAGVYAAVGLEPVVFGPGPSTGVIHAPNEFNFLSDIDGAVRFYRELMQA
jgi:acetylornithine deacetylase/succinyl-diaminopimelate desuccinylase-like protein